MRNGSSVCGIYLVWIVSTSIESPYVFIGHVGNHRGQFGVLAKESFAHKCTVFRLKCLIFAVNRFFHPLFQQSFGIPHQKRVPVRTPDQLDDIPAGAAKFSFKLLDDLGIAPHRPVESLQVAVDHKNQIVQLVTTGDTDGPH